jgi:hypothetical protein
MAIGPDHVFAREFFLKRDRANLPEVPACEACNDRKSKLEHYATSVLPFGGRHSTAQENLASMVPKRLSKNLRLQRELLVGSGRKWITDDVGLAQPARTIPIDADRLNQLFRLVAMGLIWYHWQTYLAVDDVVEATMLTQSGERFFEEQYFRLATRDRVAGTPGNGTFQYEGVRCIDCDRATMWRIKMLGGVQISGDPAAPEAVSTTVGVVTRPRMQS